MADTPETEEDEVVETPEASEEETETEAEGAGSETEGEPEGEAEGEEGEASGPDAEGAGAQADAKPQSRRDKRIATLERERNEEREKRIRAETQAEERLNNRHTPTVDPEIAKRQREEKMASMTPEERQVFETNEKLQRMEQQVALTQLQTKDALDKAKYDGRAAVDPVYAKHAQEVEQRLYQSRRAGIDVPRETVLAVIIGENALKGKPTASAKKAAANRVTTANGKPMSSRTNPAPSKPKGKQESWQDIEARIGDVEFPSDMRF